MGPIFNLDKYHYIELTYGYGRDSDDRTADYFAVELTREKPRYLVGMGFRHSVYPGYSYTIFSPSARYYVTSRFSLWGKYFGSMDSEDNFDHAYWFDCGYKVTQRTAIKVGVTGGNRIYSPEYEYALGGRADMSFSSILAHYSFAFTEKFVCKYQFENLTRQSKYHDIKNTIIIDARF